MPSSVKTFTPPTSANAKNGTSTGSGAIKTHANPVAKPLQVDLQQSVNQLLAEQSVLFLATNSTEQHAHASYAPYFFAAGKFYIYISHFALHGQNLLHNQQLSAMVVDTQHKNIFALPRLTFNAHATELFANDKSTQLDHLQTRFGNIINTLSEFDDFHLFELNPEQGRYVIGFGKAYAVDFTTLHDELLDFSHLHIDHVNQAPD